jgi:hypothetical protein
MAGAGEWAPSSDPLRRPKVSTRAIAIVALVIAVIVLIILLT